MMNPIVAISTVDDGSMYNRDNHNDPQVIFHREAFLETHGIELLQTTRLAITYNFDLNDFCQYKTIDADTKGNGMQANDPIIADALFVTDSTHALFLPVADCVGAVFYDSNHHVLGLAHLGRHSLEQNGGQKVINYMKRQFKSEPHLIKVWLTPAPSKEAYPIWALDNQGMKQTTFEQLLSAGILNKNITDNSVETDKDSHYYSYSEFLKGQLNKDGDYAIVAMMTD